MKHQIIILTLFLLFLAGCQEPSAVQLLPESDELEVTAIPLADTNYAAGQVDSMAVLPGDQLRFAGHIYINKVTYDGPGAFRTHARAGVLFEDRNREVRNQFRRFGYYGIDLGTVNLNGSPMARVPHRVPIRRILGDSIVMAGVEYIADISEEYLPNATYVWSVPAPDSISPFTTSIQTPDELTVQSPAGGSVVSRNRDLPMRWTGRGNLAIIISSYDPSSRRVRPFLHLRPRVNTGRAILNARVLAMLPRDRRFWVFTFVLANRDTSLVVGGFQGGVLIQAASVYNSYVELR